MSKKAMEVCERCGWLHQQCTCDKQLLTEIDRLSADKGELYQMLKAIVDTHRAGYAWMDMTKPQALLDRVVADHDELTLWTIEQLRAELERLKKEAHDKHWPLANACRNLLPHSNEDNVTQVWAASRKLEQLRAENKELSTALAEAVEWITEELDNIGGCDHSVGICVCSDRAMLKGLKKLLARRVEILVVGDKVHYIPFDGCSEDEYENGIVKSIPNRHAAFVVYRCDGNWEDYNNYTAALTSFDDLRPGWK